MSEPISFTVKLYPGENKDFGKLLNNRYWGYQQPVWIYRTEDKVVLHVADESGAGIIGLTVPIQDGTSYQEFEAHTSYTPYLYYALREVFNQDKVVELTVWTTENDAVATLSVEGQDQVQRIAPMHVGISDKQKSLFELFLSQDSSREECSFTVPFSLRNQYLYLERNIGDPLRYAAIKTGYAERLIWDLDRSKIKEGVLDCKWYPEERDEFFRRLTFSGDVLNLFGGTRGKEVFILKSPIPDNWFASTRGRNYRSFIIQRITDNSSFKKIFYPEEAVNG